jgi:hypothetical protein
MISRRTLEICQMLINQTQLAVASPDFEEQAAALSTAKRELAESLMEVVNVEIKNI